MSDTLQMILIGIVLSLVFVVITGIKDRENIFENIKDFFIEWGENLKLTVPGFILIFGTLAFIGWAIFG